MKKRINKNKWWLIATAMIGLVAPISLIPVLTSCSSSEKNSEPPWQVLDTNTFHINMVKPEYIQQYNNEKMLVIPEGVYTSVAIWMSKNEDYSYIVIPKNLYVVSIEIQDNASIKNLFWGEIGNVDASNYSTSMTKRIEYNVKNCINLDWFALPTYAEDGIYLESIENTPKLRNSTIDLYHVSSLQEIGAGFGNRDIISPNAKIKNIILPDTKNSKLKVIKEQAFKRTYFNKFEFPASLEEIESDAFYYPYSNPKPYFIFNSSTAIKKILTNEYGLNYVFAKTTNSSSDKYLALDLRKCTDLTYEEKEKLKVQYKDIFHSLYLPDWSSN